MAESKSGRPTYATNFIKTDVENVAFLGNVHVDNIVTTLMAMGNEMWSMRKRMHILETVLEDKGVKADVIEKYIPTAAQEQAWAKEREIWVDRFWGHFAKNSGEFTFASDWKNK